MCRRVTCSSCGRPTFAECGAHVERALAEVPPSERCRCDDKNPAGGDVRGPEKRRSWFSGPVGDA